MSRIETSSSSSSGGGSGTVTSVALADTSSTPIYTVSGSPITTSGTLDITLNTQTANTVFAGPSSGSAAQPTFRSLVAADIPNLASTYVTQSEVGAANGVASLGASGKILIGQLPADVFIYQGTWNPSTNTPSLSDSVGVAGYVYWVSAAYAGPVAGLNNPSMYNFQIGDIILYNGTQWELTTPAAGVQSVNGAQGSVTVNAINQLTGDATAGPASGSQSQVLTLATVNSNVGSFTNANITVNAKGLITAASSGTNGTVTSVSVVSANGFSGTVSNPTTTPAISISTSVTGILYGNGLAVSAAVAGNFPILNQNTTGTAANITATSNSTLTTLSSLSLPYSQVTGAPGGTVTSVALSTPGVLYTVSGSPVTTAGTLTLTLNTQTANTIFAGPATGSAATPTFRALVSADIPNNAANTSGTSANVTGVVALANGGTGLSTIGAANTTLVSNGTSLSYTAIPSPYVVQTISSTTSAVSGTTYLTNTSGASFTITLPSPVSGAFVAIKDSTGSFQTNPVTIAPHAGEMIEGLAANKLLYTNWGAWSFFSDGTNWFMGPF